MEETVNERLKVLMKALEINVSGLARVLGVSDSTVRNYVDRESKPGYEVIEKLYHSFKHINLPWLFGDPGEPLLLIGGENTINQTQAQNQKRNLGKINNTINNNGPTTYSVDDCRKERDELKAKCDMQELTIDLMRKSLEDKDHIIGLYQSQLNKP